MTSAWGLGADTDRRRAEVAAGMTSAADLNLHIPNSCYSVTCGASAECETVPLTCCELWCCFTCACMYIRDKTPCPWPIMASLNFSLLFVCGLWGRGVQMIYYVSLRWSLSRHLCANDAWCLLPIDLLFSIQRKPPSGASSPTSLMQVLIPGHPHFTSLLTPPDIVRNAEVMDSYSRGRRSARDQ